MKVQLEDVQVKAVDAALGRLEQFNRRVADAKKDSIYADALTLIAYGEALTMITGSQYGIAQVQMEGIQVEEEGTVCVDFSLRGTLQLAACRGGALTLTARKRLTVTGGNGLRAYAGIRAEGSLSGVILQTVLEGEAVARLSADSEALEEVARFADKIAPVSGEVRWFTVEPDADRPGTGLIASTHPGEVSGLETYPFTGNWEGEPGSLCLAADKVLGLLGMADSSPIYLDLIPAGGPAPVVVGFGDDWAVMLAQIAQKEKVQRVEGSG